jgi:hypothetical protein
MYSAVISHICKNCIREELGNQYQSRLCWISSGINWKMEEVIVTNHAKTTLYWSPSSSMVAL